MAGCKSGCHYGYMQSSDADGSDVTASGVFAAFRESTTAHGIPNISRARGGVKRGFWAVASLVAAGMLVYSIWGVTDLFLQRQVHVSVKLQRASELVFPAITVCNLSPVKKSALDGLSLADFNNDTQPAPSRRRRSTGSCDAGWSSYGSACYRLSTVKLGQVAANGDCQGNGGDLTSIQDAAENSFVHSLVSGTNDSLVYTAFRFGTVWYWMDGAAITYTNWGPNYIPGSGYGGGIESNGTWANDVSFMPHVFVCEKDENVVTTTDQPSTTSTDTTTTATTTTTQTTTPTETTTQTTTTTATTTQTTTPTETITQTTTPTETTSSTQTPTTSATSGYDSCCCTCCFSGTNPLTSPTPGQCNTCAGSSLTAAATCASTTPTPFASPAPTPTHAPGTFGGAAPPTLTGSRFPERQQTRQDFQDNQALVEDLADLDENTKTNIGFTIEDLILDCQYAGYSCKTSDFDQFNNPSLGNCYVYNANWGRHSEVKQSLKTGRTHGLQMILNINQNDYVKQMGDTAGLRLVVHPQDRMPFPEDEGITVNPGMATSISLKQIAIQRQKKPYGTCINGSSAEHANLSVYQQRYPVHYSVSACEKTCYQHHVITRCGCGDSTVPFRGSSLFTPEGVPVCRTDNITQDDCVYEVLRLYNNNSLPCGCPEPCTDTVYDTSLSFGQWPSIVQKTTVLQRLASRIGTSFDVTSPSEYRDNLAKVEIFYEELNFQSMEEIPTYPDTKFYSDLGGNMGLWVGISVLTLGEFIELIIDLLVLSCSRRLGGCMRMSSAEKGGNTLARKKSSVNRIHVSPAIAEGKGNGHGAIPSSLTATGQMDKADCGLTGGSGAGGSVHEEKGGEDGKTATVWDEKRQLHDQERMEKMQYMDTNTNQVYPSPPPPYSSKPSSPRESSWVGGQTRGPGPFMEQKTRGSGQPPTHTGLPEKNPAPCSPSPGASPKKQYPPSYSPPQLPDWDMHPSDGSAPRPSPQGAQDPSHYPVEW